MLIDALLKSKRGEFYTVNAESLSVYSRARGRYEIAGEFWQVSVDYARKASAPRKPLSPEEKQFRAYLRSAGVDVKESDRMEADTRVDMPPLSRCFEFGITQLSKGSCD